MAVTNVNWQIGTLLEKIGEAREGSASINGDEKLYIQDVRARAIKIEKALNDLKKYLKSIE